MRESTAMRFGILEKAAAISRRQTPNFFVLEEHNQRAVLLHIAGIECLRIGEAEGLELDDERR